MKIAIVIPWFGKDLKGGAEQQAWQIANRLAQKGVEVHVLTTCSKEFLSDWSQNFYEPGEYKEGSLVIHRFPVKKRKTEIFDSVNAKLLSIPKDNLIPGISPITKEEEQIYLHENIYSEELVIYLEIHKDNFDAFIFIPYLFPSSILGVKKVKGKAILQPCLHNECYAYLDCVKEMFCYVDRIFCNSTGELCLIRKIYGASIFLKSVVVGEGIELNPQVFEAYTGPPIIKGDYLLYLGRRDYRKNTHLLIEAFETFKEQTKSNLKLVLAGPGQPPIVSNTRQIIDLGLVSEDEKTNLLRYCKALVNPSENESFSRVIYEAWFARKPVIIHKNCLATYKALEESGFAGFACANREEFIKAFKIIDQFPGYEIVKMGIKGYKYALEMANWEKVIDKYVIEFEKFIKRKPKTKKGFNKKVAIAYFNIVEDDAVGNDILQEYYVLNEKGYDVYLYGEDYCPQVKNKFIKKLTWNELLQFIKNKDHILIYHHANYWKNGEKIIEQANCKILLKYHNITPSHFFEPYSAEIAISSQIGTKQTEQLVKTSKITLYLPDSVFNGEELKSYGASEEKIRPLAPFHKIDAFCKVNLNKDLYHQLKDGKINVLFVGRIAPNKGHKHLIEVVREYVNLYDRNIRLNIVGGLDPKLNSYFEELQNLIKEYRLEDVILFKGRVSFQDLYTYYKASDVFLLMSEHEGFCVPILEAQFSQVPIIALGKTAVSETIGNEQLVCNEVDYSFFACAINLMIKDIEIKNYLVDQGIKNFKRYSFERLKNDLIEIIEHYV